MPKSKEYISSTDSESENEAPKKKVKKMQKKPATKAGSSGENENMFDLTKMKFATVSDFKGKKYVNIREYYEKDGDLKPGKKGIALNQEQWTNLKRQVDDIDQALEDL
ncbi:hypothetical protein LSH36_79g01016 [Paralvinella palmiformis]|uniref:Transcriptional coactivator p15 (PC4) C-terminal domain-containing protein n=1 Tax=Paralvinella palmiformis TaxID=53620 RepID=A0AAD9K319_9ANNE|nr:hypothetical protein LSH36_79g01016 [Paralvinella palmiformis]